MYHHSSLRLYTFITYNVCDYILSHYTTIVQYYCLYSLYCALDLYGLFTTCYKFVHLNTITLNPLPFPHIHSFTVFHKFHFFRFYI